jgi:hypothetical protein
MTIWAIGHPGEKARFVETTEPADIIANMHAGEVCAPVSRAQKDSLGGVRMIGNMEVQDIPDPEDGA